jgi:ADP-ribose pyrophosphatase
MTRCNQETTFEPQSSENVFKTGWFNVRKEIFTEPHSLLEPYYTIDSGDGCFIIPLTTEGNVIVVKQFRPPLRRYTLELPAGSIDLDESPECAAQRELYEETGYIPGDIKFIGKGQMMMNRFSGNMFGYIALNCVQHEMIPPDNDLCVVIMPWLDFLKSVLQGEFSQMGGMGFLMLAKLKKLFPEHLSFSL